MGALFLVGLLAAAPDAGVTCGPSPCEVFSSPARAFARVLEEKPLALGLGEYHEIEGGPKVPSALWHTTRELLPLLKSQAGALVAETWMTNGRCGEVEKKAVEAVQTVTKRPASTEDELTTLLDHSFRLGFQNHILLVSCDEYRELLDPDGGLNADASLVMVKRKVEELAERAQEKGEGGVPGKLLVLYGGAIHNDVRPPPDFVDWAFGPQLLRAFGGRYLELDLIVPEYGERDDDLVKEPWFAPAALLAKGGKTVLVRPGPHALMLVFARTPPARKR